MSARPATRLDASPRPRVGFLGVGWIGGQRMRALAQREVADIVAVADASAEAAEQAVGGIARHAPQARALCSFDALLAARLDGIVIATPSGLHAAQAAAALERGIAVFCQKPLARTAAEAAEVVAAARRRDRLLAVDFCYRTVAGVAELAALARSGALGEIHAVDLVFHNAYGPDKPWFYDLQQSAGGCVMDLGIHLADLLLWVLADARATRVSSRLYAGGRLLETPARELEDFALAELQLASGATARLACSWRLPAGRDAVIEASFYGTRGAVQLRNVEGSFYDFTVEHCQGTQRRLLAAPPDDWGGRAICAWAERLGCDPRFDPCAERLVDVAALIDAVYGR